MHRNSEEMKLIECEMTQNNVKQPENCSVQYILYQKCSEALEKGPEMLRNGQGTKNKTTQNDVKWSKIVQNNRPIL